MPLTTYHGSCHCGAIAFEADLDIAETGTTKCNCTWCWKHRYWGLQVPPARFRVLKGSPVQEPGKVVPGACADCGTITFARIPKSTWNPEESVAISVAAFDDLPSEKLATAPVTYRDGFHDNWWTPPGFTDHL